MTRAFLFLLALLLAAQVIRIDTRLVEVNVIVRDQNNHPVEGLTRSDFTLFDRNMEQKIALFNVTSTHHLEKPHPPLPPGIFTNRPQSESPTTVTVVLLDAVNTRIEDQTYAKAQFIKFLAQIRPQDRVAVYALGNDLRILQDFTGDSKVLLNSLARFRGQPLPYVEDAEPDPSRTVDDDMNKFLNDKNALMADMAIEKRVRATVGALEAIANHISLLPGRKNLVWITGSFPFSVGQKSTESITNWEDVSDPTQTGAKQTGGSTKKATASGTSPAYSAYGFDGNSLPGNSQPARTAFASFDADIARATKALNDADIAVYPVDARGLLSIPKIMTAQSAGSIHSDRLGSQSLPPLSLTPAGRDSMQVMAENTGGRAFYNTNDLEHAIRDAVTDSELTYTLGFYADAATQDSDFHKLKVVVARKHVEVRYRKGYLAIPAAVPAEDQREAMIKDALWSPLDSSAISLAARIEKLPQGIRVTVSVEPSDLVSPANVEFAFALQAADGRALDVIHQIKTMDLDPAKAFIVTKTFAPNPAVTQIRIVLFDRTTGRLGSLTLRL